MRGCECERHSHLACACVRVFQQLLGQSVDSDQTNTQRFCCCGRLDVRLRDAELQPMTLLFGGLRIAERLRLGMERREVVLREEQALRQIEDEVACVRHGREHDVREAPVARPDLAEDDFLFS